MNTKMDLLLSVIIPTRNRASFLSDLLDTLATQVPVTFRWETLVIDNGSSDQTEQIVREKILSLPIEIRYIQERRPGLHNGRHRGALEARGRYLAYLDDDMLLSPTWIHGIEKLRLGQAEAVVGRILPKWEIRPPTWLTALMRGSEAGYLSLLDRGDQGFYIDPSFVYGDSFFIPKEIVFELGGFHPDSMPPDQLRYRGDGESALMMRYKEAGLRAWYDPVATAYHRVPRTRMRLDYLCKRSYAQGISDSFTEIRTRQCGKGTVVDKKADNPELESKALQFYVTRLREKSFRQLISSLAFRLLKAIPFSQPNIRKHLGVAYLAGYKYHQEEISKDPKLLEWVLQKDYWDSKPEG